MAMLTALYQAKYIPKALILWVGPGACLKEVNRQRSHNSTAFESFRNLAGWLAGSLLVPAAWAPTLNYKDPLFGTSQAFYDAYKQGCTRSTLPHSTAVSHALWQ